MAIKEKYKDKLMCIIKKHLPEAIIYLFGSRARGDFTNTSDIDLAIDAGKVIPYSTLMKILMEFDETTIPLKIDLVDLYAASVSLKKRILKEGIKWRD